MAEGSIFLVDNDDSIGRATQHALQAAGYELALFESFDQANAAMANGIPDLLLARLPNETERWREPPNANRENNAASLVCIDLRTPAQPEPETENQPSIDLDYIRQLLTTAMGSGLGIQEKTGPGDSAIPITSPTACYMAIATPTPRDENRNSEAVWIQEEERRKLGLALHDDIAQLFGNILLMIDTSLSLASTEATDLRRFLTSAKESAKEGFQQVRNFTVDLRPQILDDLGLEAALMWYAERLNRDGQARLEVSCMDHLPPLDRDQEITLFRIVQEAVQNVRKHAQAERAKVELRAIDDTLRLSIQDDGVGFSSEERAEKIAAGTHIGLAGMIWRAKFLGGRLVVDSAKGRGTNIVVTVPIGAGREARSGSASISPVTPR